MRAFWLAAMEELDRRVDPYALFVFSAIMLVPLSVMLLLMVADGELPWILVLLLILASISTTINGRSWWQQRRR